MAAQDTLPDDHVRVTYEEIHVQIAETAKLIREQFVSRVRRVVSMRQDLAIAMPCSLTMNALSVPLQPRLALPLPLQDPDMIVAIGGGGFFPARVLRTFLKKPSAHDPSKKRNIPIQAIGLALYEEVAGSSAESIGSEVVRTQWLDEGTFRKAQGASGDAAKDSGLLGKNILIVDEVDDSRTTLQYAYHELLKDVQQGLAALSPEEREKLPPTRSEYRCAARAAAGGMYVC